MFGNKKPRNPDIDSLVGSNTRIHGDIHFSGGLHIDGVVQGNVIAETDDSMVTTSERGRIEGDVKVHKIVLNGEVIGDVYAYQHVELAPQARVQGNVHYAVIEMASGASVNGNLIHIDASTGTANPDTDKNVLRSVPEESSTDGELENDGFNSIKSA